MTTLHQNEETLIGATKLNQARAAMIMLHGRGDNAEGILRLSDYLNVPGFAFVAPQAAGNTWYPNRFIEPLESNEPWLTSALQAVTDAVTRVLDAGIPAEKIMFLGFSQGACLSTEYVARNPQKYGGVVGLSGGLIGPLGMSFDHHTGSLKGTKVFLGCDENDPHIPVSRVHETRDTLERLDANVIEKIYKHLGHAINEDEIIFVKAMMQNLVGSA